MSTKWEYKHHVDTTRHSSYIEDDFQELGNDRWELVFMWREPVPCTGDPPSHELHGVFKRPVKEVEKGRPLQLGERCTNIQCGPALQCERWEGHKGLCTFQGDTP